MEYITLILVVFIFLQGLRIYNKLIYNHLKKSKKYKKEIYKWFTEFDSLHNCEDAQETEDTLKELLHSRELIKKRYHEKHVIKLQSIKEFQKSASRLSSYDNK